MFLKEDHVLKEIIFSRKMDRGGGGTDGKDTNSAARAKAKITVLLKFEE